MELICAICGAAIQHRHYALIPVAGTRIPVCPRCYDVSPLFVDHVNELAAKYDELKRENIVRIKMIWAAASKEEY